MSRLRALTLMAALAALAGGGAAAAQSSASTSTASAGNTAVLNEVTAASRLIARAMVREIVP